MLLTMLFFVPSVASAAVLSFGGRAISVIPCVSGLGPSLHVTIIPAGIFPVFYIWTPATFTFLYGPPRNPGQQVLGLADIPFVCFIPARIPIPLFGLRMFTVGTSPVF